MLSAAQELGVVRPETMLSKLTTALMRPQAAPGAFKCDYDPSARSKDFKLLIVGPPAAGMHRCTPLRRGPRRVWDATRRVHTIVTVGTAMCSPRMSRVCQQPRYAQPSDASPGKSSLLMRFLADHWDAGYTETMGYCDRLHTRYRTARTPSHTSHRTRRVTPSLLTRLSQRLVCEQEGAG